MGQILPSINYKNIYQIPSELQTELFLYEQYYLPLLHSPPELGEVGLENSNLGQKLVSEKSGVQAGVIKCFIESEIS